MTVPLMIWSALIVIDSHACSVESSIDGDDGDPDRDDRGERHPDDRVQVRAGQERDERRGQVIPSIPMLTTPARSHMTPHRAP